MSSWSIHSVSSHGDSQCWSQSYPGRPHASSLSFTSTCVDWEIVNVLSLMQFISLSIHVDCSLFWNSEAVILFHNPAQWQCFRCMLMTHSQFKLVAQGI